MAASGGKEMEIAIKIAGKVESSFKSAIGAATKGLGSITKAVSAATAAAAAAVGAIGMAAINTGREFEGAMSQVAATMLIDKTTAEGQKALETLENAARECGASTAFSATEAAEALNYLALAGYDADKAATALPTVLKLAGAGAMDLAAASDMVTDSMSALGIEATEANLTQFSDQLAQTASKANTSVAQLGEAILTVGGTAKGLAGGTTELNTALGILADNGLKGAEGGTHLRNIILSLQNPTDKAADALKGLGVDVYDAQGNMRGLNDVFKDLQGAMAGMDNASKDSIFSTLFNKTDLTAANAMLANCTDRFDELSASIENSAGACENMYAIQLDNLNGDIDILKSGLSDLGISIYKDINSPFREIIQLATGMVGKLSDAFQEGGIEGMVGAVGDCLAEVVGKIADYAPEAVEIGMSLVRSIITGIAGNAAGIGSSGAKLVKTYIMGISDMLPLVTNAALDIITSFANGLLEGDNSTQITDAAVRTISGLIQAIIDHLPELTSAGKQIILQLVQGILSGSDGSFADIAARIGILAFALRPLLNMFGGISGIMGKVTSIFGGIGSAANAASAPLKAAGGGLQVLTTNAKGLIALGAGFLMVSAGMVLISQSAIGIANAGPGAAAAFVLLAAAIAGMAIGAATLAPALATGAAGLIAFGAGVALVGVGILAATSGIALLASQLPNIATYGASAAMSILLISTSLVVLSAGALTAAAGLTAMFLPMVSGVVSTAALSTALMALGVAASVSFAAMMLLTTTMIALNVTMGSIKKNAAEAGASIENMSNNVDVITTGLSAIQKIADDALEKFISIFESESPNATAAATNMMQGVNRALDEGWNVAKTHTQQTAKFIKTAFENMTITIPKPRIPVINVSTSSMSYGDGGSVSVPNFSVSWNALGGIFDQPTIFNTPAGMQGVGEAGPEAVLPLDTLWAKMKEILNEAIAASGGASFIDAFIEKLKGIGTGGGGQPELAGAGGPTIQYSPVYNLYGSAGKEEIAEADRMSQAEFNKLMKQYEKDQQRRKL